MHRSFWAKFSAQFWDEAPGVLQQRQESYLVNPGGLFAAAGRAGEEYHLRTGEANVRFYLAGKPLEEAAQIGDRSDKESWSYYLTGKGRLEWQTGDRETAKKNFCALSLVCRKHRNRSV